ncbi:hypothetical protein [Actibacterium pelagium]|uniref:hypothetical protein n=1 Tax=Actibacterium pelagium TaxID=2029103 RepID=UPI0011781EA2|nr:hypothetical protein [Actibacterium pelagium]
MAQERIRGFSGAIPAIVSFFAPMCCAQFKWPGLGMQPMTSKSAFLLASVARIIATLLGAVFCADVRCLLRVHAGVRCLPSRFDPLLCWALSYPFEVGVGKEAAPAHASA